ncbi:MAG: Dyp-type peroxidase [Kofleriaceae bacterium]
MAPASVKLEDVQGIVYTAYQKHPQAAFLFARLGDNSEAARAFLRDKLHHKAFANAVRSDDREKPRVNIAFSADGLRLLGVPDDVRAGLPQELREGMAARGRVLDENPDQWELGRDAHHRLDVMLMIYAKDEATRATAIAHWTRELEPFAHVYPPELSLDTQGKEHFGFADGLSQPFIRGLHDKPRAHEREIPLGEILLGYPNAYDRIGTGPRYSDFDLGANGTYIVFRKLEQDVRAFWTYCRDQARLLNATPEWIAAKIIGRWPSGAPTNVCPNEDATQFDNSNNFMFLPDDRDGYKCPIASHIRRANPRDARDGTAEESLAVVDRHRILRRGRSWGAPLSIADAIAGSGADNPRGLYFIGLNASLARGFEFIQQTWLNNPGFHGLAGERDPITGSGGCPFTIPARPVRQRLQNLPRIVTNKGGGYFFLPSFGALAKISGESRSEQRT